MTNPNLPPVVYLPTAAHPRNSENAVELRQLDDGRKALLAYSALDRLVKCCGDHQPWALVDTEHLPALYAAQPYDVIYLDYDLPEHLRHQPA
ncbi:SAV_915 family protein [Amycolatopsis anabasis]|uniref:SAV_915 family protein n=1 Tax=Amycolatopsis anabasis TaxID=1840409 RepID=UPI00131D2C88|nr:SAV_915 family protein [Amycolatopsis anabasis]